MFFSQLGKRSIRRDGWGLCRDQDAYGCPDVAVFEFGGHCLADCVWIAALAMNVECRRVKCQPSWKRGNAFPNGCRQVVTLTAAFRWLQNGSAPIEQVSPFGDWDRVLHIDLSKDARCEAQAGRADLGICLIKAWSEGVQIGLSDSCEDGPELPGVVWSALALGAGWSDMKPDLPR